MVNFVIFINVIKLKTIICEAIEDLSPKDIYNFYYLLTLSSYAPEALKTDYGKFTQEQYLYAFKLKYMALFKRLLYEQIVKYAQRGRLEADFPKEKLTPDASIPTLLELIKKTFRTDMKRRNDVWIMAAEFLQNLQSSTHPKDIYIWIDRLNATVHNTQTAILGKVSHELERTYNKVHNAKSVKEYEPMVDKDLRQLAKQDIYENMIKLKKLLPENIKLSPDALASLSKPAEAPSSGATTQPGQIKDKDKDKKRDKDVPAELDLGPLQETEDMYGTADKRITADTPKGISPRPVFKGSKKDDEEDDDKKKKTDHFKIGPLQEALDVASISKEDRENVAFMSGLKMGVKDKSANRRRDVKDYPEDFVRGYNMVKQTGWWDRFNDKLTNWASSLGHSYGRRF
jgi:hypothetical protein